MPQINPSLFSALMLVLCLALSCSSRDPQLEAQRAQKEDRPKPQPEPPTNAFCIAFSPDGNTLAYGGNADPVCLWDVRAGEARQLVSDKNYGPRFCDWHWKAYYILSIAFSPDGKVLASVDGHGTVQLWDLTTGKESQRLDEVAPFSLAFSADGKQLVAGCHSGPRLFDMGTAKELKRFRGDYRLDYAMALSPDGQTLAAAGSAPDHLICLWDLGSGCELRRVSGHEQEVYSLAFSPDGKTLASGGRDQTIRLWDANTGTEVRKLEGGQGPVQGLAFATQGNILASAGRDGTVVFWEMPTGKRVIRLGQPAAVQNVLGSGVHTLAFSPNGKVVAAAMHAGGPAVLLWDAATGQKWGSQPYRSLRRSTRPGPPGQFARLERR